MKADRQQTKIEPPIAFDSNRLVLLILLGLTLLRTAAVAISPLELGVDEAQYWLWSQSPDFGYFTKPPLIAWIIGAAHWAFGHSAMAVRLPACWLQLATTLVLWQTASWLYGPRAGRLTALIWISLPAVGLGSFLISTDTPLLLAIALALLALAGSVCGKIPPVHAMIYAGIALGVGMLAKYAAIYGLFGFMLIWASGRHHPNPIIQGRHLLLVIASAFAVAAQMAWSCCGWSEFHSDHRPVAGHNGRQPRPLNTNIRSASSLTRLAGIGTGYRTTSCRPSGKPHHR